MLGVNLELAVTAEGEIQQQLFIVMYVGSQRHIVLTEPQCNVRHSDHSTVYSMCYKGNHGSSSHHWREGGGMI